MRLSARQLTLPGELGARYRALAAPIALPHRFWPKVDRSGGPDACWPWLGALSAKRSGTVRGHIRHRLPDGRSVDLLAHRVALWLSTDPCALDLSGYLRPDLPGYHACHRCAQRLCCNPAHLYFGTPEENQRDRYRALAAEIGVVG